MVAAIDPTLLKYLPLVVLTLALAIGLPWAFRVYREARGESEPECDKPDDVLGPLAEAFAAGQMSEEEYNRIRTSIEQGMGEPSLRYKYMTKPSRPKPPVVEGSESPPPAQPG
jgi:hypothetical protein